ncbi:MAG: hypothetical protein IJP96_10980 [Synergistaceae bacterium]|nr:hypothetical protein [Synergistaceae bacterium]MBR0076264.1 hypothetical protein [Synergistaceae bacterium]MBR0079067.1 hypothetical protein [Synergistaceae bacterium]MBR0234083.1 hypothetical protein [Synergistaceae bacterium]MBR0253546.1 hypothetical protein [Synergistaceae bacterium]
MTEWVNVSHLKNGFVALLTSIKEFQSGVNIPFVDDNDPLFEEWLKTPSVNDFISVSVKLQEVEKLVRESICRLKNGVVSY